jgi:hypothetical protein
VNVPAPPPGGKLFGFSANPAQFETLNPALEYTTVGTAGANAHRFGVSWRLAEPTRGTYDGLGAVNGYLDMIDERYTAMVSRGITPILVIMSAPRWAHPRGPLGGYVCQTCVDYVEPADQYMGDWRRFVSMIATRYPQAAFEIWNEPNIKAFYKPEPNADRYRRLYVEAYYAIKSVDADAAVVTGGLAGWGRTSSTGIATHEFLRRMLQMGLPAHAPDYRLGIHLYPAALSMSAGSGFAEGWENSMRELRQHGDGAREVWMTETGMTTSPAWYQGTTYPGRGLIATPAQQADILRRLYNRLMTMDSAGDPSRRVNLRAVLYHTLKDDPTHSQADVTYGFGLLNDNLTPKPAFCIFVNKLPAGAAARTYAGC